MAGPELRAGSYRGAGADRPLASPVPQAALDRARLHRKERLVRALQRHDCAAILLYEPLNRYETNLINTQSEAAQFLTGLRTRHVKILADLYHMNIEEANLADAVRAGGAHIGHVHFADSNRRAAGMGHTDFAPVVAALREVGYAGYLSAEVLPLPDPDAAARQTVESFRRFCPSP